MAQESGLKKFENFFEGFMFWSRWVQAPLYTGLIFGSFLYLVKFLPGALSHLGTNHHTWLKRT